MLFCYTLLFHGSYKLLRITHNSPLAMCNLCTLLVLQNYERELRETKRKLKKAENENELIKLEMESRWELTIYWKKSICWMNYDFEKSVRFLNLFLVFRCIYCHIIVGLDYIPIFYTKFYRIYVSSNILIMVADQKLRTFELRRWR